MFRTKGLMKSSDMSDKSNLSDTINKTTLIYLVLAAMVALTLSACSGGGGTPAASTTPDRNRGEIEALGSILLNGVKYEIEGAQLIGLNNAAEDLKPGRVVQVEGELNADGVTGKALRIKKEDTVKGPMTGFATDGTITTATIMGQTVIFEDNITKFDAGAAIPLGTDVNKVFMVSGFEREDQTIQATFVRKASDDLANFLTLGGILEVKGMVSGLNTVAGTFQINGLTVNFNTATLRELPAGGLANGLVVEVKGTAFNAATNTLTATDIEAKVKVMGDDIAKIKAEGFITNLDAAGKTFTVNGQMVNFAGASFRAGLEIDLAAGVKVSAEGPMTGGVIMATRITFKESVRLETDVQVKGVDTLTFAGLDGISIMIHPDLTRGAENFDLLNVGNQVKVRARQGASGLIATRLEKTGDAPAGQTILQGPATGVAGNIVTVLGTVNMDTATILEGNFQNRDQIITRTLFLTTVKVGDIVKGRFRNGAWDSIEIQN